MSNYQVGGSLRLEAPYVKRAADDELYHALLASQFCYVFNCRQMGKSSLRVRTVERLKQSDIDSLSLDLSTIGTTGLTARQWYASIIKAIHNGIGLNKHWELKQWLQAQQDSTPVQLLFLYIDEVLLPHINLKPFVIFLDEIDSVRDLDFDGSEFFVLIRACYNRRVDDARFRSLNFVLLGVATPSGLIQDTNKTPFNIGKGIELSGLEFERSGVLERGLTTVAKNPSLALQAVLHWTGGQPFLTQKLCQLLQTKLSKPIDIGSELIEVEKIVKDYLVHQWQFYDEPVHFKTIELRLISDESQSGKLLSLYQRILKYQQIAWNGSSEQQCLMLTGLVVRQGKNLKAYNPIYKQIFSLDWIDEKLENIRPDYYRERLKQWLDSGENSSWLLQGEELQEALQWSKGFSLSEQDNNYLNASQFQDKEILIKAYEEVEKNLNEALKEEAKAQEKTREALDTIKKLELKTRDLKIQEEKAKKQLNLANKRKIASIKSYKTSKNLTIISLTITASLLLVSFVLLLQVKKLNGQREILVKGIELEREASIAINEVSKLQGLVKALNLGFQLKKLIKNDLPFSQYPAVQPIHSLSILKEEIREKNQFMGHIKSVNSISFSHDGQFFVTASFDATVRLWQKNGKMLKKINCQGRLRSVDFHPNSQIFLTTSEDKTARVWNLKGEQQQVFKHSEIVTQGVFSPDGKFILTSSKDGVARLWNLSSSTQERTFIHQQSINSISFSPDGKTILTASDDGTARLWDLLGNEILIFNEQGIPVHNASFSPSGKEIVTAQKDGTATVWSIKGEKINILRGHSSAVNDVSFSPDGNRIITASSDSTLKLWDLKGNQLQVYRGHSGIVRSIEFSPDGKDFITTSDDRTARLWDLDRQWIVQIQAHRSSIRSVDFDRHFNRILTASSDGTAKIWNSQGDIYRKLVGHQAAINSAFFSPSGEYVVTASEDKTARLWNLRDESETVIFHGHQRILRSAVFSSDEKLVLTSSNDKTARLWTRNGLPLVILSGHNKPVRFASFNNSGNKILTASEDGTARLWDLYGNEINQFIGHTDWVTRAVFSPDQAFVLTASFDKSARLWTINGKLIHVFKGHAGRLIDASFSPNGKFILTTSFDGTARLWDLEGNSLAIFKVPTGAISSANFTSDGTNVILGSNLGEFFVSYNKTLPSLLSWGCFWVQDYLENSPNISKSEKEMCHSLTQ